MTAHCRVRFSGYRPPRLKLFLPERKTADLAAMTHGFVTCVAFNRFCTEGVLEMRAAFS